MSECAPKPEEMLDATPREVTAVVPFWCWTWDCIICRRTVYHSSTTAPKETAQQAAEDAGWLCPMCGQRAGAPIDRPPRPE